MKDIPCLETEWLMQRASHADIPRLETEWLMERASHADIPRLETEWLMERASHGGHTSLGDSRVACRPSQPV